MDGSVGLTRMIICSKVVGETTFGDVCGYLEKTILTSPELIIWYDDLVERRNDDYLAPEVNLLVTRNSSDFALISNSTTCKISSALPNAGLYSSVGGIYGKSLKICFGFRRNNTRLKQPRFLVLNQLT